MTVRQPPLPTFLIIGAQKSATRWLRSNLGEHPEVFTTPEELHAFNRATFTRRTVNRYRAHFAEWDGEPFVGESTPGYMMLRHNPEVVAERIDSTLPDVRLIALLRNPVDRAYSAMVHHIARGRIDPDTNLASFVRHHTEDTKQFSFISGGLYAASLEPYIHRFGERLLIFLHDDLKADSADLYRRAVRHVGSTRDWLPPELAEVRFSNQTTRKRRSGSKLKAADRKYLWSFFVDDVDRLEKLIDRDLSAWRP